MAKGALNLMHNLLIIKYRRYLYKMCIHGPVIMNYLPVQCIYIGVIW